MTIEERKLKTTEERTTTKQRKQNKQKAKELKLSKV
jgi:hypothetical protein